jgi:tryptophan synthase alpha subunit
LRTLRSFTQSPIAVGFGISRPEHLQAVWQEADGAIVGSSIVKKVEEYTGNPRLVSEVSAFASWLRGKQEARAWGDRPNAVKEAEGSTDSGLAGGPGVNK